MSSSTEPTPAAPEEEKATTTTGSPPEASESTVAAAVGSELRAGGERTEDATGQFADVKLATILTGDTNARGIPGVLFIDSVESLLAKTPGASVEALIGAFNELHQKFKLLETHKTRTKTQMKVKIPEITRTLELVRYLQERHASGAALTTHYSLSEMLYARATVLPTGSVCLWLGANVMIEYPYAQAVEILELSLANAKARLRICDEDIDHLRDQIITVEVNMARVFNFDVKRRRELKAAASSSGATPPGGTPTAAATTA